MLADLTTEPFYGGFLFAKSQHKPFYYHSPTKLQLSSIRICSSLHWHLIAAEGQLHQPTHRFRLITLFHLNMGSHQSFFLSFTAPHSPTLGYSFYYKKAPKKWPTCTTKRRRRRRWTKLFFCPAPVSTGEWLLLLLLPRRTTDPWVVCRWGVEFWLHHMAHGRITHTPWQVVVVTGWSAAIGAYPNVRAL